MNNLQLREQITHGTSMNELLQVARSQGMKTMIQDGLSAPLHEGAARYYREKGWMK